MATGPNIPGKSGKYGDLKRRLAFLLLALVVYRVGAHIPVPGIDPNELTKLFQGQQGGILGMFNMFSGGALSRFTVFALGIMPYISASIIMQLLTVVSPQLEAIKKEGESGRRKITQYTRYGTLLLGTFQAVAIRSEHRDAVEVEHLAEHVELTQGAAQGGRALVRRGGEDLVDAGRHVDGLASHLDEGRVPGPQAPDRDRAETGQHESEHHHAGDHECEPSSHGKPQPGRRM